MKTVLLKLLIIIGCTGIILSCNKKDSNLENEVWPKYGFLFTTDDGGDTVYVESGNMALTSPYSRQFPPTENEKKWTIALPASGEGVLIHNDNNEYWSIDSVFHPGLNVEQHYISLRNHSTPSTTTEFNRFKYHRDGDIFYLESIVFPGFYVTALGHAGSGRGLRLRRQDAGFWPFWVGIR